MPSSGRSSSARGRSSRDSRHGRDDSVMSAHRAKLLGIPPDPRPSKAHPEHRRGRKQVEEKHGGFDWTDGVLLAVMAATTIFSFDRSHQKVKERREEDERRRQQSRDGDGDNRSSRSSEMSRRGGRSRRGDDDDFGLSRSRGTWAPGYEDGSTDGHGYDYPDDSRRYSRRRSRRGSW